MHLVDEMLAGLPLSITFGTKLPPTPGIDLGIKWEKETRRTKKTRREMVESGYAEEGLTS